MSPQLFLRQSKNKLLAFNRQKPERRQVFSTVVYTVTVTFSCSIIHSGVPTAGSSTHLIWQIFTPDAFPDANPPKGFLSPPGNKPGIFCLLGECINHYAINYPVSRII